MLADEQARSIARRIAFISTIEILLWPIILVPAASATLVLGVAMFLDNPIAFAPVILAAVAAYLIALSVAAVVIDLIATAMRPRGLRLPAPSSTPVQETLRQLALRGARRTSTASLRIIPSDLSMGAHVRGALFPRVILSGGLVVGLNRRLGVARAILCHELAHIADRDKFFLTLIFLWIGNALFALGAPLYVEPFSDQSVWMAENPGLWLFQAFLNIAITAAVLSRMSIRREYMADTYAALLCGRKAYMACLGSASGSHATSGGFFHPSIKERLDAISQPVPQGLRPSGLIMLFYVVAAVPRVYEFLGSGNPLYLAMTSGAALGIASEWLRGMLFASSHTELLTQ